MVVQRRSDRPPGRPRKVNNDGTVSARIQKQQQQLPHNVILQQQQREQQQQQHQQRVTYYDNDATATTTTTASASSDNNRVIIVEELDAAVPPKPKRGRRPAASSVASIPQSSVPTTTNATVRTRPHTTYALTPTSEALLADAALQFGVYDEHIRLCYDAEFNARYTSTAPSSTILPPLLATRSSYAVETEINPSTLLGGGSSSSVLFDDVGTGKDSAGYHWVATTPPSVASTIRYFDDATTASVYLTPPDSNISPAVPSYGLLSTPSYDGYDKFVNGTAASFGTFHLPAELDTGYAYTKISQQHNNNNNADGNNNSRRQANNSCTNNNNSDDNNNNNNYSGHMLVVNRMAGNSSRGCDLIVDSGNGAFLSPRYDGSSEIDRVGAIPEPDASDLLSDFDYRPAYASAPASSTTHSSHNDASGGSGSGSASGGGYDASGLYSTTYYTHYPSVHTSSPQASVSSTSGIPNTGSNGGNGSNDGYGVLGSQSASGGNVGSGGGGGNSSSSDAPLDTSHAASCESPTISVDDDAPMGAFDSSGGASACAAAAAAGAVGHAARTPPETLEWLRNNYEPYEGASLPRCALYDHYIGHCREAGLEPVNAASFGKLIRSVFKGLRTRRLGTRGNSKYHYNGIRIKESSPLLRIVSDDEYERGSSTGGNSSVRNPFRRRSSTTAHQTQHLQPSGRGSVTSEHSPDTPTPAYYLRARGTCVGNNYGNVAVPLDDSITVAEYVANGDAFDYDLQRASLTAQPRALHDGIRSTSISGAATRGTRVHSADSPTFGDATITRSDDAERRSTVCATASATVASSSTTTTVEPELALGTGQLPSVPVPNLDELEECLLPLGYSVSHVLKFMDAYAANCGKVLDAIKHLRFDTIEAIWTTFWQSNEPTSATDEELSESVANNVDQMLIYRLSALPQVQKYMESMDVALYQVLVEVLIPDVLRSILTPRLSYQIRNFAKNVESWLRKAMGGAPSEAKKRKAVAVRFLSNALTRYTSFNHLADAARAVLRNREEVAHMYNDFCKVDFAIVRGQADWVCDCDPALVSSIESEFKENLKRHYNLDEWTEWMEAVVDQVLAKYHDKPLSVQMSASKQFLLKWSFYSSMILRDVTYRSGQSFGSFHLIRLLYDEYMCLLVEMRLARITNQPTICVMRPSNQLQNPAMIPYELQYDINISGNGVYATDSSMRGNPSMAAYYGVMPLAPSQHHLPRLMMSGGAGTVSASLTPIHAPATTSTTMFVLNNGSNVDGNGARYDTPQIVYSSFVSEYHHHQPQQSASVVPTAADVSGNSTNSGGDASGTYMGTSAPDTMVAYTLSIDAAAPSSSVAAAHYSSCASMASAPSSATYAANCAPSLIDTGSSGTCPELGDILVQDPTLASVDYSHQLTQQQQHSQRQQQQQRMANTDGFGGDTPPSHYVLLHMNGDSGTSSGPRTDTVDYANSLTKEVAVSNAEPTTGYYAPMVHTPHHHQMGRMVYMEEDDEMMDATNAVSGSSMQSDQQQHQLQHDVQQQHDNKREQQQKLQQQQQQCCDLNESKDNVTRRDCDRNAPSTPALVNASPAAHNSVDVSPPSSKRSRAN